MIISRELHHRNRRVTLLAVAQEAHDGPASPFVGTKAVDEFEAALAQSRMPLRERRIDEREDDLQQR